MIEEKNKLIILSGGMDSTVLCHLFSESIGYAVSFNYGQRHGKELQFAMETAKELKIKWALIDLADIPGVITSALLGDEDIPDGHYEDIVMKKTVVPFRNAIMLSIAVGIAESEGLKTVLFGAHAGDHAIYPDCRTDFLNAFATAAIAGTYAKIEVKAPFISKSKRDIGLIGQSLGVDFNKTWSCYKGNTYHCGTCGTCIERKEALNGFDPTIYKEVKDG